MLYKIRGCTPANLVLTPYTHKPWYRRYFFESISVILSPVQHNWQCISWLYIGSTKEFHVKGYANVSPSCSNKVKVVLYVYCALIG